jgi:hypothetical protein
LECRRLSGIAVNANGSADAAGQQQVDSKKPFIAMRILVTTCLALAITGCAAVPEFDAFCDAFSTFADASSSPESRTVVLTTGRAFEVHELPDDPGSTSASGRRTW